jgi:hypothetical protein
MKTTIFSFILLALVLLVLYFFDGEETGTQAKPTPPTRSAPARSGDADAARNLKF